MCQRARIRDLQIMLVVFVTGAGALLEGLTGHCRDLVPKAVQVFILWAKQLIQKMAYVPNEKLIGFRL